MGQTATLVIPFKGYRNIELIEKAGNMWLVEICGSGLRLYIYEDEFEEDE